MSLHDGSGAAQPITQMLVAVERGDSLAREQLWHLIYQELKRMAHAELARHNHSGLQTTSLVHEAYLRLVGQQGDALHWNSRRHFFAAAAKSMRRICVDDARNSARLKRGGPGLNGGAGETGDCGGTGDRRWQAAGGQTVSRPACRSECEVEPTVPDPPGDGGARERAVGWKRMDLSLENIGLRDPDPLEMLALDEALTRLEALDPRKAEVVMLRFFAGLTVEQAASVMGLAPLTVDNLWRLSRAWLHREMSGGPD